MPDEIEEITAARARNLATECLLDCFNSEQAGGFEGMGDTPWAEHDPTIETKSGAGFLMRVGGHLVKVSLSVVKE